VRCILPHAELEGRSSCPSIPGIQEAHTHSTHEGCKKVRSLIYTTPGRLVEFDASNSYDPLCKRLRYKWYINGEDIECATCAQYSRKFEESGQTPIMQTT